MINTNSPLESLAAFAIVFVVGILSTTALSGYIGWIKKKASEQSGR